MDIPLEVHTSRFKERILYLCENPNLSETLLPGGWSTCKPNCFGTLAYTVGLDKCIPDICKERGYNPFDYRDATGNFVKPFLLGPGYIGEEPFKLFLETLPFIEQRDNAIVTFSWDNPKTESCGYHLRHAALHLCNGKLFHQPDMGEPFSFTSLDEYLAEWHANGFPLIDTDFFTVE